jgi:hypothetical protein
MGLAIRPALGWRKSVQSGPFRLKIFMPNGPGVTAEFSQMTQARAAAHAESLRS